MDSSSVDAAPCNITSWVMLDIRMARKRRRNNGRVSQSGSAAARCRNANDGMPGTRYSPCPAARMVRTPSHRVCVNSR